MVYRWLTIARSWLFPPVCVLCDAPGHRGIDLCRDCRSDLPQIERSCIRCVAPLTAASVAVVCGHCQRSAPWFQAAVAVTRYQEPVAYLIRQLKFAGQLHLAGLLGELLAEQVRDCTTLPDFLVPVPLHRKRLGERGFNQALEISRVVGKRLNLPVHYQACKRVICTSAQTLIPTKRRRTNVRGAFQVCGSVKGKRIAIVDDVMTTGHTVNELSRMLVRAGASYVEVWVVARAGGTE